MQNVQSVGLNVRASLSPERFIEAFVAMLVEKGWKSIAPRDPATRTALAKIVSILDDSIDSFEEQHVEWSLIAPWVQIANSLRPSALGGVENWEHQLRSAQGFLTRVPNPSYEIVDFAISVGTAKNELDQLSDEQRQLVELVTSDFKKKSIEETAR